MVDNNVLNFISNKRIWCPSCETEQDFTGALGVWTTKKGHVCNYAVCQSCFNIGIKLPKRLQSVQVEQVEKRLLARYPELLDKLPDGYLHFNPGDNQLRR